jgi:hypothetical protein
MTLGKPLALAATLTALLIASIATAVPATAARCPLEPQADGNIYPVVCPNGQPNARAESKLRRAVPAVMALGEGATLAQVKAAVCKDLASGEMTNPLLDSALDFQTATYGWSKRYGTWFLTKIVEGSSKRACS